MQFDVAKLIMTFIFKVFYIRYRTMLVGFYMKNENVTK